MKSYPKPLDWKTHTARFARPHKEGRPLTVEVPDCHWIVCPIRNGIHFTREALPTFLAQDIPVKVLFIDNNSHDGSGEWLRAQQDVLYWHRRPGLGVAQSWNLALKWLFGELGMKAEHALVVNNDVLLQPCTYRLLLADGEDFVTATGVNSHEQFAEAPEPENKRPHPDFSCFLIRKACFESVGPFDEHYQTAFYEDNAYHVRMHRKGVWAHCIGVPFFHHASGTLKASNEFDRKQIQEAANQNRKRFFQDFGCYPDSPEYERLFQ